MYEKQKAKSINKIEHQIDSMAPILSQIQLDNLVKHKYTSAGSTLLDPIFQPYWCWCVQQLPMNLAPNLITLIGLLLNVVSSLLVIFYSPNATEDIPSWVLILCALGLFLYQTLDAIDGKQARRTGSSSPLGELFDHGCDAVSTIFVATSLSVALKLSNDSPWLVFAVCAFGMNCFYVAHWQTYVTGSLRFGKFDCTEAQVSIYGVYVLTALFGDSLWSLKVPFLNMDLRYIPVIMSIIGPIISMCTNFYTISKGGIGRNGSSVANTSIIFPGIPLVLIYCLQLMIANRSAENIYENYTCLYILAFGFVWSKTTIRLIVAHMTKGEIFWNDSCLIGPIMLLLDQYLNSIIPEHYVLWLFLIYNIYDLIAYCSKVCLQICCHLDIYLFKITPKSTTPSTSTPTTTTNGNKSRNNETLKLGVSTRSNSNKNN